MVLPGHAGAVRTDSSRTDKDLLLVQLDGGVLKLTLNKPESRNALSEAMMARLQSALDRAAANEEARVVVIAGNGPAFSAGHDLREISAARGNPDRGRAFFSNLMQRCSALMQTIVHHPRPVIADVRGIATAAGCQLAASCDITYASENAKFATPGVNIGLFCSTPMVALSRKIGRNHAMEMLLTGDMVDARRAHEIGLVNRVLPEAEMDTEIGVLTAKLASKSLMTLKTGKQGFYRQADMTLAEAYEYTAEVMIENMLKRDAEEGVNAFLEKRPPGWMDE